MGDLGSLLGEVKTKGTWSEEDINKYFEISNREESEEFGQGSFSKVRPYREGDDVESLIDRVGDYSFQELCEIGYAIQVLEDSGKICGVIACRNEGSSRYIGAVAVDEEFEGRGFMGELIESVYDGLPLTAKVHSGNIRAREAFQKYGFKGEGTFNEWTHMSRG